MPQLSILIVRRPAVSLAVGTIERGKVEPSLL